MRHLKRLVLLLTAVGLLVLAATAGARSGDRNHDRIPDRWEKHHHLSLKVKQARRDQDHDGLRNLAEYRAHLDPRDADSDDDGIDDSDEHAGTVKSFEAGVLVITVFGRGDVSGTVTGATEIECDDDPVATASHDGQDDDGTDDRGGDDDRGDDDHGDDACPAGALTAGAAVDEAELSLADGGAVWKKIELR